MSSGHKLFVANCTKQQQLFYYRIIDDPRPSPAPFSVTIRPGGQVVLPHKELTSPQIDAIVEQHAPYGLIDAREVDRTRPFIGMCYSLDQPVPLEAIQKGIVHNDEVLEIRGLETRKAAAIAVSNAVESQSNKEDAPEGIDLEVEQEDQDKFTGQGKPVHEVISVTKNESTGKRDARRGRGR